MIVRCFEGRSMPEVMEQVRREMGEDAVILHAQQKRSLLWWLRRTPTIRVWAAIATNGGTERGAKGKAERDEIQATVDGKGESHSEPQRRLSTRTKAGKGEAMSFEGCELDTTSSIAPPTTSPTEPNGETMSLVTNSASGASAAEVAEATQSRRKRSRKKQSRHANEIESLIHQRKRHQTLQSRHQDMNDELSELALRVERQLQLLATSIWGQEAIALNAGALGMLWQCGVDLPTIQKLFSSQPPVPDPKTPLEVWLRSVLERHLPVTGGLSPGTSVAVLVGPTGVGKTTTVAKIAANQLMHHRRRVSLVTVDVFRIGAVQQLETYARLMGLPFFVAVTPEEGKKCIQQAKQVSDLVLVDTIGRSPKHSEQLEALWDLVAAMDPNEVLLTLPANGNPVDLSLAAEKFSIFCPTGLIITKLDEATQTGVIANLVTRLNLPVAYITTGQNVPEDLEVPTSERLAEWVLLPLTEREVDRELVAEEVKNDV